MTAREKEIVDEAVGILEDASCGGIGEHGPTLDEMVQEWWESGRTVEDDAYYDTCQHVWRVLEKLIKK